MFKATTINPDHIISIERRISGYHEQRATEAAEPGTELYELGKRYGHLARHKSPTVLDLSGLDINDLEFIQMLPKIAKMNQVKELYLSNNDITGVALQHLRERMPQLEELRVDETKIRLNDGCGEIAKFNNLRLVFVSNNKLKNEDFDKIIQSTSLLRIGNRKNKLDIVRQARLLAALDYNNKTRIQSDVGVKTMITTKDEYIRTHLEKYRKEAQRRNKSSQIDIDYNRSTGFNIPASLRATIVK